LWQQAGRGGRRDRPSLAIYVAFGGPLDQYFMKNPRKLFDSSIECCHIDSQNKQVHNFKKVFSVLFIEFFSNGTVCCANYVRFSPGS
jgi:hypothetical protein